MRANALRFGWSSVVLALGLLSIAGCDAGGVRTRDGGMTMTDAPVSGGACLAGGPDFICVATEAVACNEDGSEGERTDCAAIGQRCFSGLGCRACMPNSFQCNGDAVEQCNIDGSGYTQRATCDPSAGTMCNALVGACTSPCADAETNNSYIGCEYFAVTTQNENRATFPGLPAVVIANPQTTAASVNVVGPGGFAMNTQVAPGDTTTIQLPWVTELKEATGSELVEGGAYRIVSTLPVTVYQFSPLEYENSDEYSFSNDASLLLPRHAMTGNYVVLSYPSTITEIEWYNNNPDSLISLPSHFAVVGVEATDVTVTLTFAGNVAASTGGSGITRYSAGQTAMFTLSRGDVLQIVAEAATSCDRTADDPAPVPNFIGIPVGDRYYCRPPRTSDMSGTVISATGKVGVIGGHACAFVPHNRFACDHLEEQLFPTESWDNEAIVSITQPLMDEPNIVRIISSSDGNALTFDPVPSGVTNGHVLNRGEILEFETRQSFHVEGTAAILVGQFLVGQNYDPEARGLEGDPSFSLAIPSEQYRTDYTFLAPTTYPTHYVNVTAPMDATIMLDGTPVTGFQPVGSTGFGVARVAITGGEHDITGSAPFGIVVYGFGLYTSYMYPGGLDLEAINPLI
jgi:hypothetical protein